MDEESPGFVPAAGCTKLFLGTVSERPKDHVSKTCVGVNSTVGSNPTGTATENPCSGGGFSVSEDSVVHWWCTIIGTLCRTRRGRGSCTRPAPFAEIGLKISSHSYDPVFVSQSVARGDTGGAARSACVKLYASNGRRAVFDMSQTGRRSTELPRSFGRPLAVPPAALSAVRWRSRPTVRTLNGPSLPGRSHSQHGSGQLSWRALMVISSWQIRLSTSPVTAPRRVAAGRVRGNGPVEGGTRAPQGRTRARTRRHGRGSHALPALAAVSVRDRQS